MRLPRYWLLIISLALLSWALGWCIGTAIL